MGRKGHRDVLDSPGEQNNKQKSQFSILSTATFETAEENNKHSTSSVIRSPTKQRKSTSSSSMQSPKGKKKKRKGAKQSKPKQKQKLGNAKNGNTSMLSLESNPVNRKNSIMSTFSKDRRSSIQSEVSAASTPGSIQIVIPHSQRDQRATAPKSQITLNDDQLEGSQVMDDRPPISQILTPQSVDDDEVSEIGEAATEALEPIQKEIIDGVEIIYNPDHRDVCFDDRGHPGTKDFIVAIQQCLEIFEGVEYNPKVYKGIKKKLKGRRFLMRTRPNERTSWREATKPEVIELLGECFNEERRRKEEGIPDDDSGIDSSLQNSAQQSDESLSVGDLDHPAVTIPRKDHPSQSGSNGSHPRALNGMSKSSKHSESRKSAKSGSRVNIQLDTETTEDAMRAGILDKIEGAKEFARPFDDETLYQHGMAAEQKIGSIMAMIRSSEDPMHGEMTQLETLMKRMKVASMAPMLELLQNIERNLMDYVVLDKSEDGGDPRSISSRSGDKLPGNLHHSGIGQATATDEEYPGIHHRSIPLHTDKDMAVDEIVEEPLKENNRNGVANGAVPRKTNRTTLSEDSSDSDGPDLGHPPRHPAVIHGPRGPRPPPTDRPYRKESYASYKEEQLNDSYASSPDLPEYSFRTGVSSSDPGSSKQPSNQSGTNYVEDEEGSLPLKDEPGESSLHQSVGTMTNEVLHFKPDPDDMSKMSSVGRSTGFGDDDESTYEEIEAEPDADEESQSAHSDTTGSTSDASEIPKEGIPNPRIEQFFDRLQHFFEVRRKVDERADMMDPSSKFRNMKVKNHSGGIQRKNGKFKKECQQHDMGDQTIRNLDDLYEAAEPTQRELKRILGNLVLETKGMDQSNLILVPPKQRDRAYDKAQEHYADRHPGPPESWLYDIVRASIVCKSYKQMSDVNRWLGKHVHIIRAKNRFAQSTFNGYRDLLFHVAIPFQDELAHICEIQVHHKDMKALDEQFGMSKHYEYFRSCFAGPLRSQDEILADLTMLHQFGDIGGQCMVKMLRSKNPEQLRLIAGICRDKLHEFDRALELYRKVLVMQQDSSQADDREGIATTLMSIGRVLAEMGQTEEALDNLQKALTVQEQTLGTEHIEVADTYAEIGNALCKQGDFESALRKYQKSLRIRENRLGKEHFLVISSLQDIGRCQREKGEYTTAEATLRHALKIQEAVLGDVHADVATTRSLIGTTLCLLGDFSKAMEEHRLALSIRETNLGKNQPLTAESHTDIGMVLCQKGDYDVAEWRHRKALRIFEAMKGKDDEACALALRHLGSVLTRKGQFDTAIKELKRATKILEHNLGMDNPKTAGSYLDLGNVYLKKSKIEEALKEFRRAKVVYESIIGTKHPDTARAYLCLGNALTLRGDHDAALLEHRKALAIFEEILGDTHPTTAYGYQCLADTLLVNGDKNEALIEHRKALAVRANILSKDHPDTAVSCSHIGNLLKEKGDLVGALVAYRQALAIIVGLCGEDHPDSATAHLNIGRVLTAQDDFDEARDAFQHGLTVRETKLGREHVETGRAYDIIGTFYSIQEEFSEAVVYHKKALLILERKLGKKSREAIAARKKLSMAAEETAEVDI